MSDRDGNRALLLRPGVYYKEGTGMDLFSWSGRTLRSVIRGESLCAELTLHTAHFSVSKHEHGIDDGITAVQ